MKPETFSIPQSRKDTLLTSLQTNQQTVAYIITSLSMGGAQKVLLQLLDSPLKPAFPPACIIVLRRVSGLEAQFAALNIPVIYLELEKPWRTPARLLEIIRLLKRQKVGLLYSVMHHANLFAVLLKWLVLKSQISMLRGVIFTCPLAGKKLKLVWSIHDTPLPDLYTRPDHRFFLWLTQKLAIVPERIVLVSARSRQRYIQLKYPQDKLRLIPNGIPVTPYNRRVVTATRRAIRTELNLPADTKLIGSLTRYVVEKDIPCMLEAFSWLCAGEGNAFLVLAGEGIEAGNPELNELLNTYGIAERVVLLGVRSDARRLLRAMDIATLSSRSEALPLFIAEAMAEYVPCVATHVGDVPLLLGDTGHVVAAGNPQALADGWRNVLAMSDIERCAMVAAAHQRVESMFGVDKMVACHYKLFTELLK